MNTSERLGILQRSSKNFPGRATVTVSLEIVGLFLGQGTKSEAGVSTPCLSFFLLFFFSGKMSSGGCFQWSGLAELVLWGQSVPIRNSNKPLPDFSAKLKTGWPVEKGLEKEHSIETRSKRLSILGCWASRFSALKFLCQRKRTGTNRRRGIATWLNLILPHHWDRASLGQILKLGSTELPKNTKISLWPMLLV